MGGGVFAGDSVLVAGPSGSGKSVFSTHFIAEGVKRGEGGVMVVFEEHPEEYIERAKLLGFDLESMVKRARSKESSPAAAGPVGDETLVEIRDARSPPGRQRVFHDSISRLRAGPRPTFRDDFVSRIYRTGRGADRHRHHRGHDHRGH